MAICHQRISIIVIIFISFPSSITSDCGCKANREAGDKHVNEGLLDLIKHENDYQLMTMVPEGNYKLGTKNPIFPADHELERDFHLKENFYLDKYEVSNKEFEAFVKATNYVTDAENFGDSFVFQEFLDKEVKEKYKDFRVAAATWW